MLPLLQGIQAGLLLAILLGPIFFALIQTTIEQGKMSGVWVGVGIWVSDALFIIGMFLGVSVLLELVEWDGFEQTFGTVGGLILIATGIGTTFTSPKQIDAISSNRLGKIKNFFSLFMKGFVLNTANPFTFFFWMSTMSMVALREEDSNIYALLFFTGIFITIVLTDLSKVFLAEKIREKLTYSYLVKIRIVSGVALCVFGVILMARVWLF